MLHKRSRRENEWKIETKREHTKCSSNSLHFKLEMNNLIYDGERNIYPSLSASKLIFLKHVIMPVNYGQVYLPSPSHLSRISLDEVRIARIGGPFENRGYSE